ncbi:metallophosphoesterase [Ferrovibrio sp.]|uniref:metallophosphoesterase n=1 Tax=Ferrovibrio sp. TaxID=1917215 RepID=UPI0025C638BD|nr:metallophosphoesterase [Ferrovibrio sp.]
MRIALMSDLHCEFEKPGPRRDLHPDRGPSLLELKKQQPDVLVLAGDIEVGPRMALDYVSQVSEFLEIPIIYVAGNHEFYKGSLLEDIEELRLGAARLRDSGREVHFLEQEVAIVGGTRFLGATLWTDYEILDPDRATAAMSNAGECLNDHRLIALQGRTFRPVDALQIHETTRTWLEETLAQEFGGPTVVVTHHAPARGSIAAAYEDNLISAAYVSDLSDMIKQYQPTAWLHGHTHFSFNYKIGRTIVACNPHGYPSRGSGRDQENGSFSSDFTIDITAAGNHVD